MIELDPSVIKKLVKCEKRLDGRSFDEYRKVEIEKNFIKSAEGSSRVKLGKTVIVAGIKMSIGTPYPDTPAEGVLVVNAELVPLASPEFERGPPGEKAIELARVVDRAIRESKCVDFSKLCIEPNKAVWMVNVDLDVLDDDGNLIDAAGIAAIAAIMNARLPEYENVNDNYTVKFGTKTEEKIPVVGIPISTTFVKINGEILADPSIEEINAMEARLTIGTLNSGSEIKLCSMQKGGERGLTLEEVEKIIDLAVERGKELRDILTDAVGD